MEKNYVEFTLTPGHYREMTYFNSFSIRRLQSVFVAAAWIVSLMLLLLELLKVVTPTRIMHICFLVVSVALPMLLVSLEFNVHRFKTDHCGKAAQRRIAIFGDEGIRYSVAKGQESTIDSWDSLLRIFETKNLFIIYKDARHTTVVPKRDIKADTLESLRVMMREKLGNRYILR